MNNQHSPGIPAAVLAQALKVLRDAAPPKSSRTGMSQPWVLRYDADVLAGQRPISEWSDADRRYKDALNNYWAILHDEYKKRYGTVPNDWRTRAVDDRSLLQARPVWEARRAVVTAEDAANSLWKRARAIAEQVETKRRLADMREERDKNQRARDDRRTMNNQTGRLPTVGEAAIGVANDNMSRLVPMWGVLRGLLR